MNFFHCLNCFQHKDNCFTLKNTSNRLYPSETIADPDYKDDQPLLVNTPAQAES